MSLATLHATDAVDLQMHTTRSDGSWTPEGLLDYLATHGFKAVAITDHDQVDRAGDLGRLGAARGVQVIPAVEVTTNWDDRPVDLLCFGFDATLGQLDSLTTRTRTEQEAIAQEVYANLVRQGYAFPQRAAVLGSDDGVIGHPSAIVRLLIHHGHATDLRSAVTLMRAAGYRSAVISLGEAIAAAHADGGVALLAHPGRIEEGFTTFTPALLDMTRADGLALDGIEVYYPLHTPAQTAEFAAYVETHGWLASSGSDSHGPEKRLPIPYPAERIAPLLARCGITIAQE